MVKIKFLKVYVIDFEQRKHRPLIFKYFDFIFGILSQETKMLHAFVIYKFSNFDKQPANSYFVLRGYSKLR